jgi:hypothetical protein
MATDTLTELQEWLTTERDTAWANKDRLLLSGALQDAVTQDVRAEAFRYVLTKLGSLAESTALPEITPDPWEGEGLNSKPRVGTGCSFGYGNDCYPGTIVEVSPSGHQLKVRDDLHECTSGSFQQGDWTGTYHTDSDGVVVVYTRRRSFKRCAHCGTRRKADATTCNSNGLCREATDLHGPTWRPVYMRRGDTGRGMPSLHVGVRRYYQDPHF